MIKLNTYLVVAALVASLQSQSEASVVVQLPDGEYGIVASEDRVALDSFGQAWDMRNDGWHRVAEWDPPVPVEQLRFWEREELLTKDNEAWLWDGDSWVNCGSWPQAAGIESSPQIMATTLYPNPTNQSVDVAFRVTASGRVLVQVFDVRGRIVRHLLEGVSPAGDFLLRWNGRTEQGESAAAGVYFVHIESSEGVSKSRVVLAR
jgi:hypothetical protein